jgi:RNA polymerase sigma-70 factor (ECF subfamily)
VIRLLCRLIGSNQNVEDLAQEVFLRLSRAMLHFRGEAKLETFLFRIVINVANDERKRLERIRKSLTSLDDTEAEWHERLPSPSEHPLDALVQSDFLAAVEEGIRAISEVERACVVLFYQEDRSYKEISAVLDLPVGTVKTHLHRGRLKVRERAQRYLSKRAPEETKE